MEYKKDIKDAGLIGQLKSDGMIFFGASTSKKCERLATAIYLVTNFLSDTEPMKSRLRTLSLELVREACLIKSGSSIGAGAAVLEGLHENILETLSLLELGFMAGLVSEMNFTLLKREYRSLLQTIEIKKSSRESATDSILGDNFFDMSDTLKNGSVHIREERSFGYSNRTKEAPKIYKGHSIGQTSSEVSDRNLVGPSVAQVVNVVHSQRQTSYIKPSATRSVPTFTPRTTIDTAKESRRGRILKLVKDNREVTIKDISAHFSDLSEKTIQRELVSLVESNVLKKFGERRWSRYALA